MIRPARISDTPAVAAIYGHYVRETAVTFVCREPDAKVYEERLREGRYPFLVSEEDGIVTGFAYASAFRPHDAFRWDAELTLYLHPDHTGRGTGSALMEALLAALRALGYLTAYSCVTLPNPASLALHRRFGFSELGVFPRTGYKLGRWHDVIWLQLELGKHGDAPAEPGPFVVPD